MYVMNKKWDSITNIAQCTSVYVSPEHEIKAVPTGGGAVYRLGQYETAEIARAVLNDLYIHIATGRLVAPTRCRMTSGRWSWPVVWVMNGLKSLLGTARSRCVGEDPDGKETSLWSKRQAAEGM